MSRAHVSESDQAGGIALSCQVFPLTDLTIEVLGALPNALFKKYGFLSPGLAPSGSGNG